MQVLGPIIEQGHLSLGAGRRIGVDHVVVRDHQTLPLEGGEIPGAEVDQPDQLGRVVVHLDDLLRVDLLRVAHLMLDARPSQGGRGDGGGGYAVSIYVAENGDRSGLEQPLRHFLGLLIEAPAVPGHSLSAHGPWPPWHGAPGRGARAGPPPLGSWCPPRCSA